MSHEVLFACATGTLTKNEQTVTELYTVDEVVNVDASGSVPPSTDVSPAMSKTLEIGSLCNNAIYRPEEGVYVGHSVDVALLNVLNVFGMTDQRPVRISLSPLPHGRFWIYCRVVTLCKLSKSRTRYSQSQGVDFGSSGPLCPSLR